MCEKCAEIDLRIARYKHIASRINDRIALDGIAELIEAALARRRLSIGAWNKAALNPWPVSDSSGPV